MQLSTLLALALPLLGSAFAAEVTTEYTLTHSCNRKTKRGDTVSVHYHGTLAATGAKFDASYDRGTPLTFTIGTGQVIKGWDEGLFDMCPGDKRKLTIPPEFGYGQRAMGPIPAGSTLVFATELVEIAGAEQEQRVVESSTEAPAPESAEEDGKKEPEAGRDEL